MTQRFSPTDPYPLLDTPWIRGDQGIQQNLPNDNPPSFQTDLSIPVQFWDDPVDFLGPSNQHLPAWDVVKLAGKQLPGLCYLTGGCPRRYDVKKVKGKNFATITHQGEDPAVIKVTERIWTKEQLTALWQLMPILRPLYDPKATSASLAVDIYHPALALQGISSVLITTIGLLHPTSGIHGCWEQEIQLLEWRPEQKKNVTVTPTTSASFARKSPQLQTRPDATALASFPGSNPNFSGPGGATQ